MPEGTRFDVIPGHQKIYFTEHGFRVVEGLRQTADRAKRSMVGLALSWVFKRPGVTSVLIGARHPCHVDQAFDTLETPLPDGLGKQLDQLTSAADS